MVSFRGRIDDSAYIAMQILLAEGQSVRSVARALGVSRRCIQYNRGLPKPSARSARTPPHLTKRGENEISLRQQRVKQLAARTVVRKVGKQKKQRKEFPSSESIRRALGIEFNIHVSKSTVRRDLLRTGLVCRSRPRGPFWRIPDYKKRFSFARVALRRLRSGAQFLFSDEKYVDCDDHGCRTEWLEPGEDPNPKNKEQYAMKLHVWGIIGIGVKRLVFLPVDQRVTADIYVRRCLSPNRGLLSQPGVVFQQDNAAAHTSGRTMKYLSLQGVDVSEWPARSPDLSPIENVWALLARKVSDMHPMSVDDLKEMTALAWESIPQTTVDKFVNSFQPKLAQCLGNRGRLVGSTRPRATYDPHDA